MSKDLRGSFCEFFEKKSHTIVPSSSLIPLEDPSILFTNAGMNQFKDVFLGQQKRAYTRASSIQKCVRAGGKHNDLDNVGFTARHLTFFEMMGNFSFGDYFKEDAIAFAWEYLTKVVGLDEARLSTTVHHTDKESKKIWMDKIGLAESRVRELGDADNFWQMGDTGPCGPCTEIFYDRGPGFSGSSDDRVIEVWNLVFMQFDRSSGGTLKPLAKVGVDTGMGFERLVAVSEGKETVFQASVFAPIIRYIESLSGLSSQDVTKKQLSGAVNVMADHVRSASLVIADGGRPSNEGRGYVLRKIIRRALLFSKKLSSDPMLFAKLSSELVGQHSTFWPELGKADATIKSIIASETDKFFGSLERGERLFHSVAAKSKEYGIISGQEAFRLYDTYGFPLEVTRVLATESGLGVDEAGFDKFMQSQKDQSGLKAKSAIQEPDLPSGLSNQFVGYEETEVQTKVLWASTPVEGRLWVVLQESPFFVACGGQVCDSGSVKVGAESFTVLKAIWVSTGEGLRASATLLESNLEASGLAGQTVQATVTPEIRADTERNHTATHLLHAALQLVLGSHAKQAGSLVDPNYLRFLFNNDKALTPDQIKEVETIVNDWVTQAVPSKISQTTLAEAQAQGVETIFGEKYNPDNVRAVFYGNFSKELCGGTHASNTGRIGAFKVVSESAVGTGVRSIVALTGQKAIEFFQSCHKTVKAIGQTLACKAEEALAAFEREQEKLAMANKRIISLQAQLLPSIAQSALAGKVKTAGGRDFVFAEVDQEIPLLDLVKLLTKELDGLALIIQLGSTQEKKTFIIVTGRANNRSVDLQSLAKSLRAIGAACGGKDFLQGSIEGSYLGAVLSLIKENL